MNPRHVLLWCPSTRLFGSCSLTSPPRRPTLLHRYAYIFGMAAKFVSMLAFSQFEVANWRGLNPLSNLCSSSLKVHDSVTLRVNEITDRALFTDLAQNEQQVKKCAKAFGIDASEAAEFPHQREMAKLIGAWRQTKAQCEVKTAADSAARAHK